MQNLDPKICALLLGSSPYHAKRDFFLPEAAAFQEIFGAGTRFLFLPFALADHAGYTAFNQKLFAPFDCELASLSAADPNAVKQQTIEKAEALFIGGGNTFRLLAALHAFEIFDVLREKIAAGTPYLGTSAGTTLFCPTIKTTNDMPIVSVPDMRAFDFLPFQINAHFPQSEGQGAAESRRDRLREFHEENTTPVVGLREGGFLKVQNGDVTLGGDKPAVLFRKGQAGAEIYDMKDVAGSLGMREKDE